jgi:hypothetical protein
MSFGDLFAILHHEMRCFRIRSSSSEFSRVPSSSLSPQIHLCLPLTTKDLNTKTKTKPFQLLAGRLKQP